MPTKKRPPKKKPADLAHIVEDLRALAVPVEGLVADPRNARTHDEANTAAVAASLAEFGQLKPIVVNRRNSQVVAGNGMLAAAKQLGWEQIAVVWAEQDEGQQRDFSIADNRTAELAGWDFDMLAVQIAEMEAGTPDLAAALQLAELGAPEAKAVELRQLDLKRPPAQTWVLISLPTVRFGEIAETIDQLAGVEGIILETTSNDGPKD